MSSDQNKIFPNDFFTLQKFLYGREWRAEELPFSEQTLAACARDGYVAIRPGVVPLDGRFYNLPFSEKKWLCMRCGNRDPHAFAACSCAKCGKHCVYCRHCLMMGIVRTCTQLVTWCGPEPESAALPDRDSARLCVWDGTLSPQQQTVAETLNQSLAEGESFLLWAVTGSGKTEIIYPAIERCLRHGQRVALATPRTDVVRELLPRLRAAFPDVPVSGLYAGSTEEVAGAPLVVTTAHQLIRYARCFDCTFIDEVDAFPYHYDAMLDYAVRKAAKPGAPFAFLTATPPANLKTAFLSGKLRGAMLARRYHGHPLPVPGFQWDGEGPRAIKKGRLPARLASWLHARSGRQRQAFIFVPSVTLVGMLTGLLQQSGFTGAAGVHAADLDRHAKIADFREGKSALLVTTTILERGVTVPGVDVCVVGADDAVFDARALIQISGRVGRSAASPGGEVIFFHSGKTLAMVRARREIEQMNRVGEGQ